MLPALSAKSLKPRTLVFPAAALPLFLRASSNNRPPVLIFSSPSMAEEKLKPLLSSFSTDGDYLAILSADGVVKVWNTEFGGQLAEWKCSDKISDLSFTCMACSFTMKKRRKGQGICLVALATDNGDISVINLSTGDLKWKNTCHPGGTSRLSFANKGKLLHTVGADGMVLIMNSETGEVKRKYKISKKSISSSVTFSNEKLVAAVKDKIQVLSLDSGEASLKFSSDLGLIQSISASDDATYIITTVIGEKCIQVWKCDYETKTVTRGPILSMKHPPLVVECKKSCDGDDGVVVLAIAESGIVYVWKVKSVLEEDVSPTKISIKVNKNEKGRQKTKKSKKKCMPVITAKLQASGAEGELKVLITFGSVDSPQFNLIDVSGSSEDIVIEASDGSKMDEAALNNEFQVDEGITVEPQELAAGSLQKGKSKNKRTASDLENSNGEMIFVNDYGDRMDEGQIDDDLNEPTMGEKLSSLNLTETNETKTDEKNNDSSPQTKPPSADSVHVLLKQALHADDRALLIDCLFRQDEKVIANSVSQLNPSDVLKLLQSMVSLIQSRGAVLACALPWLRSLLLQHASGIMSQESSIYSLNSLYQLIESRVSTYNQALQLSSSLSLLYAGTDFDGVDESETVTPFVYEDKDEDDEEGSEGAMETESDGDGEPAVFDDVSDFEGADSMSE